MSNPILIEDRREHARVPLRLSVTGQQQDEVFAGYSEDLSAGGAKICWQDDRELLIGDRIEVAVELPGRREPLRTEAEVRWRGSGKIYGVSFGQGAQSVLAAFLATVCGLSAVSASASATVPTFDPNADFVVEDTGPERPDEHTVEEAFFSQNEAIDECVEQATQNRSTTLEGSAKVEILLNPDGNRPLGVNADLPTALAKHATFRECLRRAVAGAPFPSYNGPPVVVALEFELDPGYEIEEEW